MIVANYIAVFLFLSALFMLFLVIASPGRIQFNIADRRFSLFEVALTVMVVSELLTLIAWSVA
jgi:hypothetical protein